MAAKRKSKIEVKLGFLMPGFLVLGILLNLAITRPPDIVLNGFADVAIRPNLQPDYQQDTGGGVFPAVDPEIMNDARGSRNQPASGDSGQGGTNVISTPTPTESSGSSGGPGLIPTVVSIVPTLVPPIVPTVVSIVPTTISAVPTVVSDTLDTVETLVSPLDLLLP